MTRKEAKERGLTRYFNRKPCPVVHIAERKTVNGGCVECRPIHNAGKARELAKARDEILRGAVIAALIEAGWMEIDENGELRPCATTNRKNQG